VTGFGLLGHALEMARGSKLALNIRGSEIPLLTQAAELAQQGFVTGASHRNWASYGNEVLLPAGYTEWRRHLLTDPQTSGGLLIACTAERADAIVRSIGKRYPAAGHWRCQARYRRSGGDLRRWAAPRKRRA
jgi:selenide,water dikinase